MYRPGGNPDQERHLELPVRNLKGEVVGTAQLSDALFGVELNRGLVHQALVMYGLNQRQGTHATKTRGEVSGGGRKPWPQKGTGKARQGSIRAPQWRHGGVAFGPQPADHRVDMPRKMRRQALRCVLSEKARGNRLVLVDALTLEGPNTRGMRDILSNLGLTGSTLIVTNGADSNVVLSARNLEKVWTSPVSLLNAGLLLRWEAVVMTLDAARHAEEMWAASRPRRKRRGSPARHGSGPGNGAAEGQV
jgi:large subunit ribosomal protein L4